MTHTKSSATPATDPASMDELARIHMPALRQYFRRKGFVPPDDEDAAQEVFVRLARRSDEAPKIESSIRYMFATAASVVLDTYRRKKARAAEMHEPYDERLHAQLVLGPEAILSGREDVAALLLALKELPARTRAIFILARLEQMKQPEIASRLGVSLTTVEKSLSKAWDHLTERLELDR